jgi:hypothetical protein
MDSIDSSLNTLDFEKLVADIKAYQFTKEQCKEIARFVAYWKRFDKVNNRIYTNLKMTVWSIMHPGIICDIPTGDGFNGNGSHILNDDAMEILKEVYPEMLKDYKKKFLKAADDGKNII